MQRIGLFDGIGEDKIRKMLHCFKPEYRSFKKGESIMLYAQKPEYICVLLQGRAHLSCVDKDGEQTILEYYGENDIFGEAFDLPYGEYGYIAEADTNCEVMFILFSTICGRCKNTCEHHTVLVENLFRMTAQKAQMLALRISVISKKTVKNKLSAYLYLQSERAGKNTFTTDLTWSKLADYLCVDRTSLMRELRALKTEGKIRTKGRSVTILQ